MTNQDGAEVATCTYCGRESGKENSSCPRCGNVFRKHGKVEKNEA